MKIIKIAQSFEYLMPQDVLEEYKILRQYHTDLSNQLFELFQREDERDIEWVNKKTAIIKRMNELTKEEQKLTKPYREERIRRIKEEDEEYRKRKKETEQRFQQAKEDSSFQQKIINKIKRWPRTQDPKLAGYILKNGAMLKLSYENRDRDMDHREIAMNIDELDGGTSGMYQFMYATGAIRMHLNREKMLYLNWVTKPTVEQKEIMKYIAYQAKEINVDPSQSSSNSIEFNSREKFIEYLRNVR